MKLKKVTEKITDTVDDLKAFTRKWVDIADRKKNNKTALIVGIVCAVVVILAAAVTVAVILRKKQKKQLAADNRYDPEIIDDTEKDPADVCPC